MADSLLDLYLGGGKAEPEKEQSGSLVDLYLGPASTTVETPANVPRITVTPRVRQSDDPVEEAKLAQESEARNTPVNVPSPSGLAKAGNAIAALPADYGGNVAEAYKGGINLATQGLGDVTSNNPASGVGKIGLGLLGAAVSPVTGAIKTAVEDPISGVFGKDVGERAGFVAGAALPVAPAIRGVKAALPTNKAVSAIVDTIGADNLPAVINELKSNPRLSLMDVVPATRQMAQKLITNEGPHQNKFEKFVTDRVASGKDATSNIYDSTMGTPVNVLDKVNALKKAASEVGKKDINPAVENSGFVDVSKVINNIDAKLKPGVNSVISAGEPLALGDIEKPLAAVRKFIMDDTSVRTDPKSLHQFQAALRAKAEDLLNSTDGQNRQKGHALMQVRNDIVDAIDKASPKMETIPKEFKDLKVKTSSGTFDPTGAWFVKGDKPTYAQATPQAAEATLGPYAKDLANYDSISGARGQHPITVWYKKGEEDKAKKIIEVFEKGPQGSKEHQIAYHKEMGEALGYHPNAVNGYLNERFSTNLPEGSYKPALSKYRDEKQVENAFNMGQLVTRNKLGRLEDSPEFWDKWVKDASPQELEAAREGARLAVQHQIAGFKAGARKGQDIVESEFNRDKLSSLFGEKEVNKMAKSLQDERKIAITNSKLIDNSQTAMRMKADSRVDLPTKKDNSVGLLGAGISELANMAAGSGVPGVGTAAYLGAKAASAAKYKFADLPLAKARNSKITDYLTATGEDRADLIKILESHIQQPKLSLVNRARLALPTSRP